MIASLNPHGHNKGRANVRIFLETASIFTADKYKKFMKIPRHGAAGLIVFSHLLHMEQSYPK